MARKMSRQGLLKLLNAVDGRTYLEILNESGLGGQALGRKARKAIEETALTDRAEDAWRGWLGMNGREKPTSSLMEGPSPQSERRLDAAEGYVPPADEPFYDPAAVPPPPEEPEPQEPAPTKRTRSRTSVWVRLTALRPPSSYEQLFTAYMGDSGRHLVHPHRQLRHYVQTAPKVPKWIVDTVMSVDIGQREGTGWPRPEPQAIDERHPGDYLDLAARLAELEGELAVLRVGLEAVSVRVIPQPSINTAVFTLPFRLTVNAGARIVRAIKAFGRAITEG